MSTLCQALYTFKIRFKFVNSTRAVTFRAWRCPWLPNEVTGKQGRHEPAQPPGHPPPRWPRPVLAFSALPRGAVVGDGGRLTGRSVPGRRRPWCSGSGSISPSTPWSTTPTEVETRRSPSSKAERPPSRRLPGALSLRRGCAPRFKSVRGACQPRTSFGISRSTLSSSGPAPRGLSCPVCLSRGASAGPQSKRTGFRSRLSENSVERGRGARRAEPALSVTRAAWLFALSFCRPESPWTARCSSAPVRSEGPASPFPAAPPRTEKYF